MDRVGRFELRALLGQGGMGAVWRARDPALGREVALKLVKAAQGTRRAERLIVEARAAAALVHPHVVRVHEVGEHQGVPYLVMDLVEGETLRSLLEREGRLPPTRTAEIAAALASALAAAHGQGIAHRDLKPENVLMAGGSWPLLTDFGLARLENEARLTRTGELLGTPAYMAPEQLAGDKEQLGPACDVFALGTLLFELSCGRRPFQGETFAALAQAIASETPPAPAGVDAGLAALWTRCLEKDPARRPSMSEVEAVLRAWRPGGVATRRAAPMAAALGLAIAGVVIASLLAASAIEPPSPEPPGAIGAEPSPSRATATPVAMEPPAPSQPRARWFEALAPGDRPPTPLPRGLSTTRQPGVYTWALPTGAALELVWIPGAADVRGFYLGRSEVSWDQYAAFLAHAGGAIPGPGHGALDVQDRRILATASPDNPAIVSWREASAFCRWAGLRLPGLAEWQRAASLEQSAPAHAARDPFQLVAVQAGDAGASGCLHLADNLCEWSQDAPAERPENRFLLGGSYAAGASLVRASSLLHLVLGADTGVRVALSADGAAPGLGPWTVQVVAFQAQPGEAKGALRDGDLLPRGWAALQRGATRRLSLVLPELDLAFREGGPGELPEAEGLPEAAGFPRDCFATRATARARLTPGSWRLSVGADDGVRVRLDDELLIDVWRHGVWSHEERPDLLVRRIRVDAPREAELVVEHVELYGHAGLRVVLEPDGE